MVAGDTPGAIVTGSASVDIAAGPAGIVAVIVC
jgi:hypothetical protein